MKIKTTTSMLTVVKRISSGTQSEEFNLFFVTSDKSSDKFAVFKGSNYL
jgi:hypothetical protein